VLLLSGGCPGGCVLIRARAPQVLRVHTAYGRVFHSVYIRITFWTVALHRIAFDLKKHDEHRSPTTDTDHLSEHIETFPEPTSGRGSTPDRQTEFPNERIPSENHNPREVVAKNWTATLSPGTLKMVTIGSSRFHSPIQQVKARMFTTVLILSTLLVSSTIAEGKKNTHVVLSGETLWDISRQHGCDIDQVQQLNQIDDPTKIRPGDILNVPYCTSSEEKKQQPRPRAGDNWVLYEYRVESGDTLGNIARRFDTTVEDLRRRNSIKGHLIQPDQVLRIAMGLGGKGRPIKGQSVGRVDDGRLVNGVQLTQGRGYYRRRPQRAFGANHTIYHIRRAAAAVRGKYPKIHDLSVGDISARKGGQLAEHKSHQSGLDVDLGFYYDKKPKGYPESFFRSDGDDLNYAATWMLLELLAQTASTPSGVDRMFLDYGLQEVLYKWGEKNRKSKALLRKMFQYPHGQWSASGLIRHEPGHDTHIHVRFRCPTGDESCK